MIALTHIPSPHMEECERAYTERVRIDHALAGRQHHDYCEMLRRLGVEVITLDVNVSRPDCAFIEDTAIVLDEVAVLTPMGTESRRAEPAAIKPILEQYRIVKRVNLPALLEGGDVLQLDRTFLVGLSSRTNHAGIAAFDDIVRHFGYQVMGVPVRNCLHFKTACTALTNQQLLVNPAWVDCRALRDFDLVHVSEEEPWAANVLRLNDNICLSAAHPRTAELISQRGLTVHTIDVSEFAKAEGGVTCLSLIFAV